jgi:hypothetical protein
MGMEDMVNAISIFVLRRDRPAICVTSDKISYTPHWSQETRANRSSVWDLVCDYTEKRRSGRRWFRWKRKRNMRREVEFILSQSEFSNGSVD